MFATAGVLGIGVDVSTWTDGQRNEARDLVARYKEIREVVHTGVVYRLPDAVPVRDHDADVVVPDHVAT